MPAPAGTAGITVRHRKHCSARKDTRCPCGPSYRASAYDGRSGKQIKRTFPTLAAAKLWREDMRAGIRRGAVTVATGPAVTVGAALAEWVAAARAGIVRTRGRKPFAPGTIRAVEQNYRLRIEAEFGSRRLDRVTLLDLQDWIDRLDADGLHASTIESSVLPLRMLYRRAKTRGTVAVDPTDGLELPQKPVRGTSRRPPAPEARERLVATAPAQDRPVWRVFLLTGLRRGELLGLRWSDVDLDAGLLHVAQQYDPSEAEFRPTKGRRERDVPMSASLGAELRAHRMASGRRDGLVFGQDGRRPLDSGKLQQRADAAWKAAGVDRATPHALRHLYASLMAAAGVPLERLSRYMGHSSIAVTFDNYGHLFPGDEAADATLQEAFMRGLDRASAAVRASTD